MFYDTLPARMGERNPIFIASCARCTRGANIRKRTDPLDAVAEQLACARPRALVWTIFRSRHCRLAMTPGGLFDGLFPPRRVAGSPRRTFAPPDLYQMAATATIPAGNRSDYEPSGRRALGGPVDYRLRQLEQAPLT